jgi:hypothetical protein
MPAKRRFTTARMLLTGLACWGLFVTPALAGKRVRGKGQGASPVAAVARAPKGKGKRSKPVAPPVPRDEGSPTADPNPPTPPTLRHNTGSATAASTTTAATSGAPAKPRVYTFGGLDVTGNLKAPQMLFFRGRVQQELDTSSPEKRSFLKELERTADAKGL